MNDIWILNNSKQYAPENRMKPSLWTRSKLSSEQAHRVILVASMEAVVCGQTVDPGLSQPEIKSDFMVTSHSRLGIFNLVFNCVIPLNY